MRALHRRLLLILPVLALLVTSCVVPPSCLGRSFASSTKAHLVTVRLFCHPIAEPKQRYPAGMGMWERFEHGSIIDILTSTDGSGSLAVSNMGAHPRSCTRMAPDDLDGVSRAWQAVLALIPRRDAHFMVMSNRYTFRDDWRADGPLLELSFGQPSGRSFGLMWDGHSPLPQGVDAAVMETLEVMCSNNRLARTQLLHSFPEVSSRLTCQ